MDKRRRKSKEEKLDKLFPFRVNGNDVETYFGLQNKYSKMIVADKTRRCFKEALEQAVINESKSITPFDEDKFNAELDEYKKEKFLELI